VIKFPIVVAICVVLQTISQTIPPLALRDGASADQIVTTRFLRVERW
jgi:hypothetical protein